MSANGGSPDSAFHIGDLVEIHGLQGAKELNGLTGQIISVEKAAPSEAPSRFGVRIEGNGEKKSVKGANLRMIVKDDDVASSEGLRYRRAHHDVDRSRQSKTPLTSNLEQLYLNEDEYPDIARARTIGWVIAGATVVGFVVSRIALIPNTWAVVLFVVVHIVGCCFLTDCSHERGLLFFCAVLGMYGGIGFDEFGDWIMYSEVSDDSIGPWSLVTCFACLLYLQSFWTECFVLPPDCISGISFFFPMYPAYSIGVALSCIEFFWEWRYSPNCKIWTSAVCAGALLMATGQFLIWKAGRIAGRNYWASCREAPDEDGNLNGDCLGLEIPDRRIVRESFYSWERHPAYVGGMLWGLGVELALCNPIMLIIVALVLWSSFLYVCVEEEQELYDEFPKEYAKYAALTPCRIPGFDSILEDTAFQREMMDAQQADSSQEEESEEGEDEEDDKEDLQSEGEDGMLSADCGVQKGGAIWNRQFREPWMLG